MSDLLFLKAYKNYLKTANTFHKHFLKNGFSGGVFYEGKWEYALRDPRREYKWDPYSFSPSSKSTTKTNEFPITSPKWFKSIEFAKSNSAIVDRYSKQVSINMDVIAGINEQSYGLLEEYFQHYESTVLSTQEDIGDLALISLISPNIHKIAKDIMRDLGFVMPEKKYSNLMHFRRSDYDATSLIQNKSYSYISKIHRSTSRKQVWREDRTRNNVKMDLLSFYASRKSRYFNWESKIKPSIYPVNFTLSRPESELFIVFELFKKTIAPKLEFKNFLTCRSFIAVSCAALEASCF
jgi:hypothetical protein